MKLENMFKKTRAVSGRKGYISLRERRPEVPEGLLRKCNKCGSAIIADGVISTDNTKLVGTHGTILLSGNVNVAEGSVDSRAIVLPEINAGNASLALAFVNPAVGIGSFLAQLLLRTPLSHLFKVEYSIKGPWENPVITKVSSGTEEKPTQEN